MGMYPVSYYDLAAGAGTFDSIPPIDASLARNPFAFYLDTPS